MDGLTRALGALALGGAVALTYAGVVETRWFALRRFEVPILPPDSAPITALQLSDLHFVPGQERKVAWVRDLARLAPDLVINTGDNLSHMEAVPGVVRALDPLMGFPGLFVLGSNDIYAPHLKNPALYLTSRYATLREDRPLLPVADLTAAMTGRGWHDLGNTRALLEIAGRRLEFVGVDDPHIARDDYPAVSGSADPSAAATIGVVHAPYQRVLNAMTADGVDAIIAGHTHGGQLAIPGYGALVTNCDLDTSRAKGLSRWWLGAGKHAVVAHPARPNAGPDPAPAPMPDDAPYLHVSAGLGTSRYAPVRFACRPEATLLTLIARPT